MRTALIAVGMLAASIWVGSLVCLAVVAAASRRILDQPARVALFRQVGRLYGLVGTGALLVAIAAGLALAWPPSTVSGELAIEFVLSGVLVAVTAAGMVQARRMTVARQQLVDRPGDRSSETSVRRGAGVALALRGSIAVVTLVMIVVGARLLDR